MNILITGILINLLSISGYVEGVYKIFDYNFGINILCTPDGTFPVNDTRYNVRSFAVIDDSLHIFYKTSYYTASLWESNISSQHGGAFLVTPKSYLLGYSNNAPWIFSRPSGLISTFTHVGFQRNYQNVLMGGHSFSVDAEYKLMDIHSPMYGLQTLVTTTTPQDDFPEEETPNDDIYFARFIEDQSADQMDRVISGNGFFFLLRTAYTDATIYYYETALQTSDFKYKLMSYSYLPNETMVVLKQSPNIAVMSPIDNFFMKNGFIHKDYLYMANENQIEIYLYHTNITGHYFKYRESVPSRALFVCDNSPHDSQYITPYLMLFPVLLILVILLHYSLRLTGKSSTYTFCMIDRLVFMQGEDGMMD